MTEDTEEKYLSSFEINRMSRDFVRASKNLTHDEARYLVTAYYNMQEDRIRYAAQEREMTKSEKPHEVITWLKGQSLSMEKDVKNALDIYSANNAFGEWPRSVKGIGPVLAAGLIAHFDIHKAETVGHFWSFAGIDSKSEWKKGGKRPWNPDIKVICWKIGQSFMKFSTGNNPSPYGVIYRERKALEVSRNEAGLFADQAREKLEKFKISKTTDAYKWYSGEWVKNGKLNEKGFDSSVLRPMLPPAHIDARARRYAVKLFLSHLHEVWYKIEFKKDPPLPYPIAILGHAHKLNPKI